MFRLSNQRLTMLSAFSTALIANSAFAQTDTATPSEQAAPETEAPEAIEPAAPASTDAEASPEKVDPDPQSESAPTEGGVETQAEPIKIEEAPATPGKEDKEGEKGEEISNAELDDFLADSQLDGDGFQPSLKLSGFADFNYTHFISEDDDPWRILYNNKGHFGVGNLNLYIDSQLTQTLRSFAEVRFTYLPHGNVEDLGPPTVRRDNSSSDYTRNERDIKIGGIRIERVWLQWSPHELFNLTAGHWLTPYGLWNVDHRSPTIVPVTRPFVADEELLPESQTGLLVEGRFDLTDRVSLEYAAGLSNGRGPIDAYYDYDANKGLTGRLKLIYSGGKSGDLQVGVSGYKGRYTDAVIDLAIEGESLSSSDTITVQFDETALAGDVRYTNGGFLFQTEAMLNDRVYTDEGRAPTTGGLSADSRRWGIYGLTGYRFKWFGVMPYVIGEYSPVPNASIPQLPREVLLLGGGLNIRAVAQVVVKIGYDQAILPENRPGTFDEYAIRRVQGQIAWAF